jgi:hypothetical protein
MPNDYLIETSTPLSFRVRVTHEYWNFIISIKHPAMTGRETEMREALSDPDEIRRSRSDANVYLFYKAVHAARWVCAVAKQLNGDGFLITAYPTDAIKEGEPIWHK